MSRLKLEDRPSVDTPLIVQNLTQEFARYNEEGTEYRQPLISIDRPGERTHLLVIWDDWHTLSQQERSSLIMDAYQGAYGESEAREVSVAMGLTQDEATQLGISFVPA